MEFCGLRSPSPSGALIVVLRNILGAAISVGNGERFPDTGCTLRSPKLHVEDAEGADDAEGAASLHVDRYGSVPAVCKKYFLPLVTFSSRL
jgi:hypothetical protein